MIQILKDTQFGKIIKKTVVNTLIWRKLVKNVEKHNVNAKSLKCNLKMLLQVKNQTEILIVVWY